MLADSLRALIADGESDVVEFKTSVPPIPVLARTLAAFANARGGVLLLGVDERATQRVVGVDGDRAEHSVHRALQTLAPPPEVLTSRVFVDDVEVVAVEVGATRHFTLAPDGLFVRAGQTDRPLTPSEAADRLSKTSDEQTSVQETAALVQAVAQLTGQLEAQKPMLESLSKANRWSRKAFWLVLAAVAGAAAKEVASVIFG